MGLFRKIHDCFSSAKSRKSKRQRGEQPQQNQNQTPAQTSERPSTLLSLTSKFSRSVGNLMHESNKDYNYGHCDHPTSKRPSALSNLTSKFSRSVSNLVHESNRDSDYNHYDHLGAMSQTPAVVASIPVEILTAIFTRLCPHANDETYLSSEESLANNGCPLCSARDLANASRVSRKWHSAAQRPLYQSIRLEQVHFCELEEELWRRRNRRSFFRNGDVIDSNVPIKATMRLLYRTIQENEDIANTVRYLKAPYWVREGCKQELTLLVSLLPNLRYVDLPQEATQADSEYSSPFLATLKSRCAHLRLMEWKGGAETNFTNMAVLPGQIQPWPLLEEIVLSRLKIDDAQLLSVLRTLPNLTSVKLEGMTYLTDGIFGSFSNEDNGYYMEEQEQEQGNLVFPPVKTLIIVECPNITMDGLRTHLLHQQRKQSPALENLSLIDTGITPDQLNPLLSIAPVLKTLSIKTTVRKPCPPVTPTSTLKYLTSSSLQCITYDIIDSDIVKGLTSASPSYYTYIADSLCTGHLSSLRKLYVNEVRFAVRLRSSRALKTQDFLSLFNSSQHKQKCDVYCKGHTETTWKCFRWMSINDREPHNSSSDLFITPQKVKNPFAVGYHSHQQEQLQQHDKPNPTHSKSFSSSSAKDVFFAGKLMHVIDMEPEKTYAAGRGFLALSPAVSAEENGSGVGSSASYLGASSPSVERPLNRKERKGEKRRSLIDTYGMGAEYY